MFKSCGTIKKDSAGNIVTSVGGYRLNKNVGVFEDTKHISFFKGYVYQMKYKCKDKEEETVEFVVTAPALLYLKQHNFFCSRQPNAGIWWIGNRTDAEIKGDACADDTLAIFDSKDQGTTVDLYVRGVHEEDVPRKPPETGKYMRSWGQWFIFPAGGELSTQNLVEHEIEFLSIPVSF